MTTTTPTPPSPRESRASVIATKLFSRKFLVAIAALGAAIVEGDLDQWQLIAVGAIALVYIVAEAFVDRGRLDDAIVDGIEIIEAGAEAGRTRGASLSDEARAQAQTETLELVLPAGVTPDDAHAYVGDAEVPGGAWARRIDGRWALRVQRVIATTMLALVALTMSACGTTQLDRARTVLAVSAQTTVAVEQIFEPAFAAAGEAARAEAQSYDEYVHAMRRWYAAATSIRLTAAALRLAEMQLDAIERGMGGDVMAVLACVGESVEQLFEALALVVDIPPPLTETVRAITGMIGGQCAPPSVPSDLALELGAITL